MGTINLTKVNGFSFKFNHSHSSIPGCDFGGTGNIIHFAHANGYPPGSYRELMELLSSNYHVLAMEMRPLWQDYSPKALTDWNQLSSDFRQFLDEHQLKNIIGCGHSMGGTTTLRLALHYPEYFNSLVLIDPVIFPPIISVLWNIFCKLGLETQIHPLSKSTLRRRKTFSNRQTMFDNYRTKTIFENISDPVLWDYVNSIAKDAPDGTITLSYSPEWESLIYTTGIKADIPLWKMMPGLQIPCMIIRAENSSTFWKTTAKKINRLSPKVIIQSIPNTSHLAPLEQPKLIFEKINQFLSTQVG